ncbi:hypothetical protein AOCH_000701 [Aspergillus ochraceoroseus]|uniref:TauD/TfdA-like domain-containing protein n=1 Tax=Aspergillus ochraceoroseus TaxID=138278 RepID=A0A0F8WLH3_9EURO|nr:hypothetical protein AOCH_000701 [Aspergillus ochraceoroseus]
MAQAYNRLSPEFRQRLHVTRYIVGYKKEESDYLLKFLYDHIALSQDLQARVRWLPGTVVVWDNRVAAQSALVDWADGQRRPSGQNHAPG